MKWIGQIVNDVKVNFSNDGEIYVIADDLYIENVTQDKDIIFKTNDGGTATEVMRIDGSTSNIGIGTSSPTGTKLQVDSSTTDLVARFISSDNKASIEISDNDTTGYLSAENDAISIGSVLGAHANNLNIKSTNVGIGTTSPDKKLHLHDASRVDIKFSNTGDEDHYIRKDGDYLRFRGHDDSAVLFELRNNSNGSNAASFPSGNLGIGLSAPTQALHLQDSKQLALGTGADLRVYHDGSNSYITQTGTGDLYISQEQDDKDIIFQSDDGSGGTTAYLTLDGSAGTIEVAKPINLVDDLTITGGNGGQLTITSGNVAHDAAIDLDTGDSNGQWRIKAEGSDETFRISNVDQGGTAPLTIHPTTKTITLGGPLTVGVDDTGHDVKFFGATSGRYLHWDESEDTLKLQDNVRLKLGSGPDLEIYHDGSNSYITQSGTGHLQIRQTQDDKDIKFECDDGSGGTTTYFYLDGSVTRTIFSQEARFTDSVNLKFGTGGDMMLYHDGSNSYLDHTGTGDLLIRQGQDDKDIKFVCDDGSGGLATYLTLDGSAARIEVAKNMRFADSVSLLIGGSSDLSLLHDGFDSYMNANGVGNLYIKQNNNDKDIIFQSDDGAGGAATYFSLDGSLAAHDGSATTALFTKWGDNSKIVVGNGADGRFYHNATNTYLENTNGDLYIQNKADDKDIIFQCDDGSGGVETYFFLDGSLSSGNPRTIFPDNSVLGLGTGADLQLYHDGSNGVVQNLTGSLTIQSTTDDSDVILKSDDGSGGLAAYLTLDGSAGTIEVAKNTNIAATLDANSLAIGGAAVLAQATISAVGAVELATSAETQTGTDAARVVTPDTLAAKSVVATIAQSSLTDDNRVTITHNLGTSDVIVQLFDMATEANVYADVARTTDDMSTPSTSVVTVDFGGTPANDIRCLITSLKGATTSGTIAYT